MSILDTTGVYVLLGVPELLLFATIILDCITVFERFAAMVIFEILVISSVALGLGV